MGGERETELPQKTRKGSGNAETIGNVRIHESGGEVHFHDDKNGRKVAIPVARWFELLERAVQDVGRFEFVDRDNEAVLYVRVRMDGAKVDVELTIDKCKTTGDMKKLLAFTYGN